MKVRERQRDTFHFVFYDDAFFHDGYEIKKWHLFWRWSTFDEGINSINV